MERELDEGFRMKLQSIQDAVDAFSLEDILHYEVSGVRTDDFTAPPEHQGGESNFDIETQYRTAPNGVEYRMKVTLQGPFGQIMVDASARYETQEEYECDESILLEFGTNVATMTLFPYMREAVSSIGSRIGVDVKLPLLQRGDITFN